MRFTVEKKVNGNFKNLKDATLKVGWFEDTKYDDDTKVVDVAEWQEFGYKQFNVAYPPRPFVRPTAEKYGQSWMNYIKKRLKAGDDITDIFKALGGEVKGKIQEKISEIWTPPLAESTIKGRLRRGNKSKKPLVDTGVMLASIGYKVEEK